MYAFVGLIHQVDCYGPRHHFYFVAQAVSSDPDIRTEQNRAYEYGLGSIRYIHPTTYGSSSSQQHYRYIGQADSPCIVCIVLHSIKSRPNDNPMSP